MLAIGRALVAGPRLLMLDEPSMGLAPLVVAAVMAVVRDVAAAGTAVLLVEQNARAALGIARRGYVIENGRCALEGSAAELSADPRVVAAYLGARRDRLRRLPAGRARGAVAGPRRPGGQRCSGRSAQIPRMWRRWWFIRASVPARSPLATASRSSSCSRADGSSSPRSASRGTP